ncbi:MAG: radical SAM protein, partial [Candidatus Aminicenantes bacterium]
MAYNDSCKPFIKKFSDGGFFYIYDVNTNQIIEVEKSVYDSIDKYEYNTNNSIEAPHKGAYQDTDIKKSQEKIIEAGKNYGLFSNYRPKKVTLGIKTTDGVKKLHGNGLSQIILEITRSCNQNCSYCPTSGKYSHDKTFKKNMSRETFKKCLDFFCERSLNSEKPFITFYGGEPLLRFDLIREAVEYVKTKYDNKKYSFNLTTNTTLLNKEILDFFIKNDFSVMVSLDGPEKINDRYRRFKNGKGTFNRIMKNLELIKQDNKEYFSSKLSISSVLSPPFDKIDEILDFFTTNKTLKDFKGNIRSNLVYTRGTSFIEDFGLEESFKELPKVNDKFIKRIKKSILANNLDDLTIEKNQVYSILYNLARRPIKRLYDHVQPIGA